MPRALITGVDGQDGSYLAELLLEKGYQVTGWIPREFSPRLDNLRHILDRLSLVEGDLADQAGLLACVEEAKPDEIYNLAAPSSPMASWNDPLKVSDIAGLGVLRLLEAVRQVRPKARFYQASSSELFGIPVEVPQSETSPFHPRNPYGIAKLFAHWSTVRYRERYGLFTVAGILFNHESPRRGLDFVTRKVTWTAARIKLGLADELRLGDLEARRDWGYAGDYVRAMWQMLNCDIPEEFVIGTGVTHTVRELCALAFSFLDMDYRDFVRQDPQFIRPPETAQLVADPRRAHEKLGWQPRVSFEELVEHMVRADLAGLQAQNGV